MEEFKVGDVICWPKSEGAPVCHWKILSLLAPVPNRALTRVIHHARLVLIKTAPYSDSPEGTIITWSLDGAKRVGKPKGKPHPLTNIFKD